jgi:hypothetical protein
MVPVGDSSNRAGGMDGRDGYRLPNAPERSTEEF